MILGKSIINSVSEYCLNFVQFEFRSVEGLEEIGHFSNLADQTKTKRNLHILSPSPL